MRIKIFLIIFYLTIVSSKADTIFNLIKIPNLEIYELETKNKLRYLYAKQPFTLGLENNITCYNSNKEDIDKKYEIIKKNLDQYSLRFLKKINLKYVVLCENLSISGINTAGIPDHTMKTLIIDIKFNDKYFERVIHHEVFHIINDAFKEIFDKTTWSNYNKKDFKYADCSTCTNKVDLETYSNSNGFITEYSKSTVSEDMAEVFSHIMVKQFPKNLDPILKNKIKYIESKISLIKK